MESIMAEATDKENSRSTHVIHEKDQVGRVIIADEVFASIAALAAAEVDGVASLAPAGNSLLYGNPMKRSAKVEVGDGEVTIYLSLNMRFGYNIPETSRKVQDKVVSAIENMIGYKVSSVNIKIAGVIVDD